MDHMVLVLDESGAKGYATNNEKYEGEIGVMAGYLYTDIDMINIERMFSQCISPFSKSTIGKFHITDLEKSEQKKLRDSIFNAFQKAKVQWFYKAIYSEGFHQSEFTEGRGGEQNKKKSLHVELFEKMLIMSLCMAHSIGKNKLKLVVKTDNVDSGTLTKFKNVAEYVRDLFLQNEREIFTHVKNGEKYQKIIAYQKVESDSIPKFDDIEIEVECNLSSLTVAADILANSVHYYLRERQKDILGKQLNNKKAIGAHPLVKLAYIAEDENDVVSLLDVINRRE